MASPPGARLPSGTLIDNRYEVRGWLGQGSFGEVYEVLDQHQQNVVALKLLRSLSGPTWQEAQVLTNLRSEYILPVWNADHFAGVPYLVTELAAHGTAQSRMVPCGVPPVVAVRWVRSACRGTSRTHDANLLHRDIKPDNLFLTAADEALLGDFGIAALMNGNGEAGPGGTPQTMAPEVAAGGATTRASDVYSLGATLYALLAGRYAHDDPDPAVCMAAVVSTEPARLRDLAPHVGRALAERVAMAMARGIGDRYETPADLDAALGQLPAPERAWIRTDEHTAQGHTACWRGAARGKSDATVCAVPQGSKYEVVGMHQPSGRRITAACRAAATEAALPRNLRVAMSAVA